MWAKILAFVGKYGAKAVKWAWDNKWMLLSLGEAVWDFITGIWG
ncbi:MAG: aureocin A53 family class IId bacteriocin [Clostridiales bacterium]|nr:aureocin A53 family class IId bacteriocin [Clostridiales bacterium]MDU3241904.1 aureocin A53 family class IId bacteriocin [Clostridiales bacterium]